MANTFRRVCLTEHQNPWTLCHLLTRLIPFNIEQLTSMPGTNTTETTCKKHNLQLHFTKNRQLYFKTNPLMCKLNYDQPATFYSQNIFNRLGNGKLGSKTFQGRPNRFWKGLPYCWCPKPQYGRVTPRVQLHTSLAHISVQPVTKAPTSTSPYSIGSNYIHPLLKMPLS